MYFAVFVYLLFKLDFILPKVESTLQRNIKLILNHTAYSRNNMGQKCEGNCGLWALHEMIKKIYPGNLKKISSAVWKLPAK